MEHTFTTTLGELLVGSVVFPHAVLWALGMLWGAVPGTGRVDNPFFVILQWMIAKEIKFLKFVVKRVLKKAWAIIQKAASALWEAILAFLAGRQGWPRVARWACNALTTRRDRRARAERRRLAAAAREEN